MGRSRKVHRDALAGVGGDPHRFTTGDAASILGLPVWRFQKFLDSPSYPLSPSGQLGSGKGSRRMFSLEDVYRIGIAVFLVRDAFAPKFVGRVLREIDDRDLIDFDERGDVPGPGIGFIRGEHGPRIEQFPSNHPPEIKAGGALYYYLDLNRVIRDVDRRIAEKERKTKGR